MNAVFSSVNLQFVLPVVFVFALAIGLFTAYLRQRNH